MVSSLLGHARYGHVRYYGYLQLELLPSSLALIDKDFPVALSTASLELLLKDANCISCRPATSNLAGRLPCLAPWRGG